MHGQDKRVKVFYSYSHKDEKLREKLESHLALLKHQGVIADWSDRKIRAGGEWEREINTHLDDAAIIMLLVSVDFLASKYCYDVEVRRALARHKAGVARVIPVILRQCDWARAPFAKLQALPRDGRPVTSWRNRDEAFTDIVKGIIAAIKELNDGPAPARHRPDDAANLADEQKKLTQTVASLAYNEPTEGTVPPGSKVYVAQSSRQLPAKKTSKGHASGKAPAVKGRKFEDDVAELYRLQGAEVVQNIEICNKKVNILATFSYPVRHRVIVECKDGVRAVDANQRVMQFHGLLDSARKTGEAESAEIVTRVPWGDAAKGYANREGIRLLTYAEKVASLIDFSRYLKELVSKFEVRDPARPGEPALGKYYVDLSAVRFTKNGEEKIEIIDTYVQQWLGGDDTQRHLAIFGEYGAGKSTFCQKLAHDLAASFLEDPNSSRIPILLNLREFVGKLDIETYITSFLDTECKVSNPKIDLFHAMNDAGIFLLIFDGLDEMAVKVDADTLESNLVEIDKLAASPGGKVILTSRPEYFVSAREEQEALNPALNPLRSRKAKYDPVKILPWDENKVAEFLRKRVTMVEGATERWEYYRDRIRSIGSLSDLSQRPVLLDMIVKTLPALIASKTPINRPNLYRTYLIGEIKRQKIQKRRTLLITEQDRLSLLQRVAVWLYNGGIEFINFADARSLIKERINPPKYELEAYTRDFLTNSFLIRRGDEYHFSHKSIMEYLVAAKFNEEIRMDAPDAFQYSPLQPVIVDFLKEFDPDRDTLSKWIDRTKKRNARGELFMGGNAATLLCAISPDALAGKDLSGVTLNAANLMFADLNGTNLKGAYLISSRLEAAQFSKGQLTEANILNCTVLFLCTFRQRRMEPIYRKIEDKVSIINAKTPRNAALHEWHTLYADDEQEALICMKIELARPDVIDTVREILSDEFEEVALYEREYNQLLNKYPDFEWLINKATRENI